MEHQNTELLIAEIENDQQRKEILLFALNREDSLVNNRLIWVLTIQGFLFTAIALSLDKNIAQELFMRVAIFMGLAISIMGTYLSICANLHINRLKTQWGSLNTIVKDVSPFGSGPHRPKSITNLVGLSFLLPVCTGIAWLVILYAFRDIVLPCVTNCA